jgi:hypothetical protein
MTQNNTAAKAANTKKEAVEKAPKDTKNGVTRPRAGTKTGKVWEASDSLSSKTGSPATRKDVIAECMESDINAATAATQYGRWRKYHDLKAEPRAPKATPDVDAPADDEATADAGVE